VTDSLRTVVAPACLAILSCCTWSQALAQDAAGEDPPASQLALLRTIRYAGPLPDLKGLSAAREVKSERLRGGKDYSAAYRSQAGCVVFYNPLRQGEHDLAFKWQGPRCDGRPVHGEGTLWISYRADAADGTYQHASVYRGSFENGMLTGEGEKTNFSFGPDGTLRESIFHFTGSFVGGLLDGAGRKSWTGPADGEPSAHATEGQFAAGTPQGEVVFGQLRPYPGVEAEVKTLRLAADGRPLLQQPDSQGAIFFTGEATGWRTKVSTLDQDGRDRQALFFRGRRRFGGLGQVAGCTAWEFHAAGLRCGEGVLTWQPEDSSHRLRLPSGAFRIPLPIRAGGNPFLVRDQEVLTFSFAGSASVDEELRCSADLSSCRGTAILEISSQVYFSGQVEYERGEVRPVSGTFRMGPEGGGRTPARDLASCQEFRSPTRCRRGLLWRGESSWTGGYEIWGLEFDPRRGYAIGRSPFRLTREGEGRIREGKRWVDARADEDRLVSVGRCDDEGDPARFTCRLADDGKVEFLRR